MLTWTKYQLNRRRLRQARKAIPAVTCWLPLGELHLNYITSGWTRPSEGRNYKLFFVSDRGESNIADHTEGWRAHTSTMQYLASRSHLGPTARSVWSSECVIMYRQHLALRPDLTLRQGLAHMWICSTCKSDPFGAHCKVCVITWMCDHVQEAPGSEARSDLKTRSHTIR